MDTQTWFVHFFPALNLPKYFFCIATKDKFETLHLPDLINDVPISFTVCLSPYLQHYMITATPSGGIKGGHRAFSPSRRLFTHSPLTQKEKIPKSAIFGEFVDFWPSESHFALSMPRHKKKKKKKKKNLVPPLATPSDPKCFPCCCFVVAFMRRVLFINKTCFSHYSDNVGA